MISPEQQRRNDILATIRNPRNWLSKKELAELNKSKKPAETWIKLRFGLSVKDFIQKRQQELIDSQIQQKSPASSDANSKRKRSALRLGKAYDRIEAGIIVSPTRLSRQLRSDEEVLEHRNAHCSFFSKCNDFIAIKNFPSFSCIKCCLMRRKKDY